MGRSTHIHAAQFFIQLFKNSIKFLSSSFQLKEKLTKESSHHSAQKSGESESEEEDVDERPRSVSPHPQTSAHSPVVQKKKRVSRKQSSQQRPVDDEALEIVDKLVQQGADSEQLHSHIQGLLSDHGKSQSASSSWGAWISSMIPQLHRSVLNDFYKKSFDLMMSSVRESEAIFTREKRLETDIDVLPPITSASSRAERQASSVQPVYQPSVHTAQHPYMPYQQPPATTAFRAVSSTSSVTEAGLTWQSALPAYGQPIAVPTTSPAPGRSSSCGSFSFLQDVSLRGYTPNSQLNTPAKVQSSNPLDGHESLTE